MNNDGQITSFGATDDKSSMTPVDPQQGSAQTANISSVSEGSVPTTDMTRVLPRQVSTGVGRGVQSQGANNFQMNPGMAQQVINDNTTNRVLIGNIGNDWGMKVSKPGFDVTTASDNDLIFNSSQNVFKIVKTIQLQLQFTRSSGTFASYVTSQPHELDFTPSYQYDLALDPNISTVPPSSKFSGMYLFAANVAGTFTPFGQAYCTVDATYVYFQIDISTLASGTYTNTATVYLEQQSFGSTS